MVGGGDDSMAKLKKVNDKLYQYHDEQNNMLFTMKFGDRGVLSRGSAWYLKLVYPDNNQCLATFCTKSDGNGCEKEGCEGRLWTLREIIPAAEAMIEKMLPKGSNRLQIILINAMQMHAEKTIPKMENGMNFWREYLEQLGTNMVELASLGVDVDELIDVHY